MSRETILFAFVAPNAIACYAQQDHSYVRAGARIQLPAHNEYPDHGKHADRLDPAIAAGTPFTVKE